MTQASEDELTAEALSRLRRTPDPRLRQVMESLVRHLHAFAKEVRLSDAEWFEGVGFLTTTGRITSQTRQEFILLSDTLGLSSLVDLINHSHVEATEPAILGPLYVAGSPWRSFGSSMVEYDNGGDEALIRGSVTEQSGEPIAGAVINVWQNAASGLYAVQRSDYQPITNLRGRYVTDDAGRFEIRTILPVPYSIPSDGPVGQLLEATGRHPWRAAHVHIKVSASGFEPLTSHVFDAESDCLDSDAVFGVKSSLIAEFTPGPDGLLVCEWPIVLVSAATHEGGRVLDGGNN